MCLKPKTSKQKKIALLEHLVLLGVFFVCTFTLVMCHIHHFYLFWIRWISPRKLSQVLSHFLSRNMFKCSQLACAEFTAHSVLQVRQYAYWLFSDTLGFAVWFGLEALSCGYTVSVRKLSRLFLILLLFWWLHTTRQHNHLMFYFASLVYCVHNLGFFIFVRKRVIAMMFSVLLSDIFWQRNLVSSSRPSNTRMHKLLRLLGPVSSSSFGVLFFVSLVLFCTVCVTTTPNSLQISARAQLNSLN